MPTITVTATSDPDDLSSRTYGLLGVLLAMAVGLALITGCIPTASDPSYALAPVLSLAILLVPRQSVSERLKPFLTAAKAMAILTAASVLAAFTGYAAQTLAMPMQDELFLCLDRATGFDWLTVQRFVCADPILVSVLGFAYGSFFFQVPLVAPVMALSGRIERLDRFLAALLLTEIVMFAVNAWLPAAGQAGMIGPADRSLLFYGATPMAHLNALRDGTMTVIELDRVGGLVSFPSLHCAVAYLVTATLWPIRRLRWPVLVLNLIMVASSVTHGAHYLSDCVAGLALAAFCFRAARRAAPDHRVAAPSAPCSMALSKELSPRRNPAFS